MKTRGSAVRFVAVSATVPNIDDVAHWIASRSSNGAAATLQVSPGYSVVPVYALMVQIVWRRISALPAFAFRIRFPKGQESE
jgi:hypothetical protein